MYDAITRKQTVVTHLTWFRYKCGTLYDGWVTAQAWPEAQVAAHYAAKTGTTLIPYEYGGYVLYVPGEAPPRNTEES